MRIAVRFSPGDAAQVFLIERTDSLQFLTACLKTLTLLDTDTGKEMFVMMVVLSNATRRRLMAIAEEYHLSLPIPESHRCGSFVPLEDVHHAIHSLKPLAKRVSAIRELVHVLTEASQQLDPILPCNEVPFNEVFANKQDRAFLREM
ncbi:MAG: hypothetical protein VKL39_06310 [Leptolyngbyaceae bacterium]|nr:hypothetical protein [Leptolyngbyaceae bacterium]